MRLKPSGGIEEADQGKKFLSRHSTIEAIYASERGRSRRHFFFSFIIGLTDALLCCDVHLLINFTGSEGSFVV
jgi:hypothetical protein